MLFSSLSVSREQKSFSEKDLYATHQCAGCILCPGLDLLLLSWMLWRPYQRSGMPFANERRIQPQCFPPRLELTCSCFTIDRTTRLPTLHKLSSVPASQSKGHQASSPICVWEEACKSYSRCRTQHARKSVHRSSANSTKVMKLYQLPAA